jgi:hypothetical protein
MERLNNDQDLVGSAEAETTPESTTENPKRRPNPFGAAVIGLATVLAGLVILVVIVKVTDEERNTISGVQRIEGPDNGVTEGGQWPLHISFESWGPCPGPEGSCWERKYLHNTGRFEVVNYQGTTTYELGTDFIGEYEALVRTLELRTKRCGAPMVLDYSRTDILYGRERSPIRFPGCEDELDEVDNLIAHAVSKSQSEGVDSFAQTYQPGDQVDILVRITTYEAETGGGDDMNYTLQLNSIKEEDQNQPFRIGGLNDAAVSCVDEELQRGDIARLQGIVRNMVPEIGVIMSCDDPATSLVKVEDRTTGDVSLWKEYSDREYKISFRYPNAFMETVDGQSRVALMDDTSTGTTYIRLIVTEDVSEDVAEVPSERLVSVGDTQGYLYYYREGAGYSGVLQWQTDAYSALLQYDAIGTGQSEEEIEEEFALIVASIQLTSVFNTQLIQQCPDAHIVNKEPCVYMNSPDECNNQPSQYYILDNSRREIEEFDATWIEQNCSVTPEEVY